MSDDSDDFEARLDARARERWAASTRALVDGEPASDPARDDALIERALDQLDRESSVVPLSSRRIWIAAAAAALAAAIVVAILMRPGDRALPAYDERVFEGGVAEVRSDASPAAAVFLPGTRIRWSFTPREDVSEPVALRILAQGPTRRCVTVADGQRISPTGAVEIEGPIGEVLGLPPGTWTLTAFVGARASIEAADDPCAPDDEAVVPVATRQISIVAQ
jgi:hypothetical protein